MFFQINRSEKLKTKMKLWIEKTVGAPIDIYIMFFQLIDVFSVKIKKRSIAPKLIYVLPNPRKFNRLFIKTNGINRNFLMLLVKV